MSFLPTIHAHPGLSPHSGLSQGNATQTAVLVRRALEMIRAGRIHAARAMLNALVRMDAPPPDLAEIEGSLLLREGRPAEALPILTSAIAATPDRPALYLCRADARIQMNDAAGAASDAADAVVLDRTSHAAKAMLGVALIELGRHADATGCLHEAVRQQPRSAAYRQGLAAAQERGGDSVAAGVTIAAGLLELPESLPLHIAGIMVAMRRRDFTAAAGLAEAARLAGVADACVFGLRGHALSSLGRSDEALAAYAEALKLAPEDRYVRHLVASGGLGKQVDRAPAEYLQTVFDGYADRFEEHLIGLGYRVPGLLRAEAGRLLDRRAGNSPDPIFGPILDLGCGTGLAAVALSDLPGGPWTGVDLSGRMLAAACDKKLYHDLIQDDLLAMLGKTTAQWQLILAADVFCYFGALDTVLPLAAARLAPGGAMMFTVEELEDAAQPWQLGRQGRFSHGYAYIAALTAQTGLSVRTLRRETLRYEGGAPVPGLLVVLEQAP